MLQPERRVILFGPEFPPFSRLTFTYHVNEINYNIGSLRPSVCYHSIFPYNQLTFDLDFCISKGHDHIHCGLKVKVIGLGLERMVARSV